MSRSILRGAAVACGFALALAANPAAAAPGTETTAASPGSPMAGHFRLRTAAGETVDSDALAGTPYAIFFGFTQCPDICPTTLADLTQAMATLPPAAASLRIYFVSVDPADEVETMARYTAVFDPRIVALGGSPAAIASATGSFGIAVERSELPGGGATYGHTATVFLVDADGLVADRTSLQDTSDAMAEKLAKLMGVPRR